MSKLVLLQQKPNQEWKWKTWKMGNSDAVRNAPQHQRRESAGHLQASQPAHSVLGVELDRHLSI